MEAYKIKFGYGYRSNANVFRLVLEKFKVEGLIEFTSESDRRLNGVTEFTVTELKESINGLPISFALGFEYAQKILG